MTPHIISEIALRSAHLLAAVAVLLAIASRSTRRLGWLVAGLFATGLAGIAPGRSTAYYVVCGVKFLLAGHIAMAGLRLMRADVPESRRNRLLAGVGISAVVVIVLGITLRHL